MLDFARLVASITLDILPFIGDDEATRAIVRQRLAAVPAGGYLAIRHMVSQASGEWMIEAVRQWNHVDPTPYHLRRPEQITAFFDGLDLVEPGMVPCP